MTGEPNQEPHKPQEEVKTVQGSLSKINAFDICSRISELCHCSHLQSRRGLDLTTSAIIDLTVASGHLVLNGVGTFVITQRKVSTALTKDPNSSAETIFKSRVKLTPSQVLKGIINEPLGDHSIALANFEPTASRHSFRRVSSQTLPELSVIEKVVLSNKSNTEDLFNLMHCRGIPSKEIAHNLFHALRAVIRDALVRNESVIISGFGKFSIKQVPARQGINPRTSESITIPAHRRVSFRPGKEFQNRVAKYTYPPS